MITNIYRENNITKSTTHNNAQSVHIANNKHTTFLAAAWCCIAAAGSPKKIELTEILQPRRICGHHTPKPASKIGVLRGVIFQ